MPATAEQIVEIRATLPDDQAPYMFTDEQLNAIFDGQGKQSVTRTLAWACFALGGSALLVDGVRNDEIATNTSKAAAEWRLRAAWFFGRADDEDGGEDYFDLVSPEPGYCVPELAPRPWDYQW